VLRLLPYAVVLILWIYCCIDCIQTDEPEVRNLPKPAWLLLVVLFPPLGSLAWLVAGRPVLQPGARAPTGGRQPRRASGRATAPDDDPEFLATLRLPRAQGEMPPGPRRNSAPDDGGSSSDDVPDEENGPVEGKAD
jgi:phospholipase D-like protein